MLCLSLGSIESMFVLLMDDYNCLVVSHTYNSGEEDSKEDSKEKEKSEKETDKFFHSELHKPSIASNESKVLYNHLLEHQCAEEVESPPPEFIFS